MSLNNSSKSSYLASLFMCGCLYFIFGFVSWVNSILIPYFKVACDLHNEVLGYLVAFAFYIAYLVMSIPASIMLNKIGFKRGVEYGLWVMAIGALLFVPAALTRTYALFLAGLFSFGIGLAILQTAANPFVTIIGPIESAARRISIMGICNKFAGIVSPLIFSALVIREADKTTMELVKSGELVGAAKEQALDEMILNVIPPYLCLAVLLFVFGFVFYKSSIPDIDPKSLNKAEEGDGSERKSIFAYPYLILGALAMFCHVGSQVISVDTSIRYAESMGATLDEAKILPSLTLACILVGYLCGIALIPKYLKQQKALLICTVTGLVLSLCVIFASGSVELFGMQTDISLWFLILLGLPNSLIFAGIWPLAIRNLGKYTNLGSSFLVMGLCGNAFLPLIYGWVADNFDLRMGYWVLVPCFLYLIFYAAVGHRIEHWTPKKK
ncbi:MAG: sugar MFS transporter [Alistipes sp.]|nr:sugar MFS transporter [Alistipes sp.]